MALTFALLAAGGAAAAHAAPPGQVATTATATATPVSTVPGDTVPDGTGLGDNEFLPDEQDVGDCVGLLERPNCGSPDKGGWRQYLVMLALVLGVAFIAWRVARLVRRRDEIVNAGLDGGRPGGSPGGATTGGEGNREGDADPQ